MCLFCFIERILSRLSAWLRFSHNPWHTFREEGHSSLTGLRELYLWNTQTGDAGLDYLKPLTSLEKLALGTHASDAALQQLDTFPRLSWLSLVGTNVTNSALEKLGSVNTLTGLNLGGNQMGDLGLQHVKNLTALEWLHLEGPYFTDSGVGQLTGLTSLRWLELVDTSVTTSGTKNLKRALPMLKIINSVAQKSVKETTSSE